MGIFNVIEASNFLGRQIRLYRLARGQQEFLYNTSEIDIAYENKVYVSYQIADDGIKQKGEVQTDDFTLSVPVDNPIAVAFRGTVPSDVIKVQVRVLQYGDTEAPLVWTGYVTKCRLRDEMTCDLVCNSQVAYLNRRGLRLGYTRQCPHALYDDQCRVDPNLWGEGATVTAVGPKNISFGLFTENPNAVADRFTGGFLQFILGASEQSTTERIAIESHTNNGLLLLGLTTGIAVGASIVLYPGCHQVPSSCKGFNNIANYGGWIMLPGKSPFDGDPVF